MKVTHGEGPRNTYCGPAALSVITGKTAEECAELLRARRTGKRRAKPVTGAGAWELESLLRELGWSVTALEFKLGEGNLHHRSGHYFYNSRASENGSEWSYRDDSLVWRLKGRDTLWGWLKRTLLFTTPRVFLVTITGHFVVIADGMFYDNRHHEGVPVGPKMPRAKCQIRSLVEVKRDPFRGYDLLRYIHKEIDA